jgi:hypothetical protein
MRLDAGIPLARTDETSSRIFDDRQTAIRHQDARRTRANFRSHLPSAHLSLASKSAYRRVSGD